MHPRHFECKIKTHKHNCHLFIYNNLCNINNILCCLVIFDTDIQQKLLSPRAEHEDDDEDDDREQPEVVVHPMPASKQLLGFDNALVTPPPSPADFLAKESNLLLASRAEAERMDLTQQLLEEEKNQGEKEEQLRRDRVLFEDRSLEGNND